MKSFPLSLVLTVFCTVAFTACLNKTDAPANTPKETVYVQNKPDTVVVIQQQAAPQAAPAPATPQPLNLSMQGQLGDDPSAVLYLANGSGTYSYYNGSTTRTVKVDSYNPQTGKLRLRAYAIENGQYIGVFDGTLSGSNYKGRFTNYKGVTITFSMYNAGL